MLGRFCLPEGLKSAGGAEGSLCYLVVEEERG